MRAACQEVVGPGGQGVIVFRGGGVSKGRGSDPAVMRSAGTSLGLECAGGGVSVDGGRGRDWSSTSVPSYRTPGVDRQSIDRVRGLRAVRQGCPQILSFLNFFCSRFLGIS